MNGDDKNYVVSYLTLRKMVGWIGLLMPFAVRLGALWLEGIRSTESISAYYYTGMRDVFVSTLVLVGILFTCYRTPSRRDNVVAVIAGLAAVGIGLFPTDRVWAKEILSQFQLGTQCLPARFFLGYHRYFVAVFFLLAFYLVTFRFAANTPENATRQKEKRNVIYRLCGVIMAVSFIAIGILFLRKRGESIFWPETSAVVAFGIAWLVKGQTVLKDPDKAAA